MNDLISRSALIDSLYSCEGLKGRRTIEAVITTINEQPTVATPLSDCVGDCKSCWKTKLVNKPTVEPVRGEWVNTDFGILCTACRRTWDYFEINPEEVMAFKHCPECGADMRGEKNE